jgi:hypothetical protein
MKCTTERITICIRAWEKAGSTQSICIFLSIRPRVIWCTRFGLIHWTFLELRPINGEIAESTWPSWVGSSPLYLSMCLAILPEHWNSSSFRIAVCAFLCLFIVSEYSRWTKSLRYVILNMCTVSARLSGLMLFGEGGGRWGRLFGLRFRIYTGSGRKKRDDF